MTTRYNYETASANDATPSFDLDASNLRRGLSISQLAGAFPVRFTNLNSNFNFKRKTDEQKNSPDLGKSPTQARDISQSR